MPSAPSAIQNPNRALRAFRDSEPNPCPPRLPRFRTQPVPSAIQNHGIRRIHRIHRKDASTNNHIPQKTHILSKKTPSCSLFREFRALREFRDSEPKPRPKTENPYPKQKKTILLSFPRIPSTPRIPRFRTQTASSAIQNHGIRRIHRIHRKDASTNNHIPQKTHILSKKTPSCSLFREFRALREFRDSEPKPRPKTENPYPKQKNPILLSFPRIPRPPRIPRFRTQTHAFRDSARTPPKPIVYLLEIPCPQPHNPSHPPPIPSYNNNTCSTNFQFVHLL